MRLRIGLLLLLMGFASFAHTQEDENFLETPSPAPATEEASGDVQREPAAVPTITSARRRYPGGADEDDLQVQARLPEATLKTDARGLQRDVYKSLYNQDLKDERQDAVEE